jgi:poly-gamma-glutamate capsule biosynthesis protein CapA/YwtB (metallophosphatase superfamily)
MTNKDQGKAAVLKLFLAGDVMTGRGIDQALPFRVDPVLYESYIRDARGYLWLAEQKNGRIEIPVPWHHIWGDALEILQEHGPDLRLVNLETSITGHDEPWPGKGINYRMHPGNIKVLTVAGIDHCSLANNHILDWGQEGLVETIKTLESENIKFSGAGKNIKQASSPSVLNAGGHRVLVFAYGSADSGVPGMWGAGISRPGVKVLGGYGKKEIEGIKTSVASVRKPGDVVIFSIHWGGNWGHKISEKRRMFAHQLIDDAGIDVVFGHSSHHPLSIEVHKEKLIIYGTGDLINDYEGITGHEQYRGDLSLMYFPAIEASTGNLKSLKMVPVKMNRFSLTRVPANDAICLHEILCRENKKLGSGLRLSLDNSLWLEW